MDMESESESEGEEEGEIHDLSDVISSHKHMCVRVQFPEYSKYESRLATFIDWPIQLKQKPEELAEAGFYYTGVSDHTRCFLCGHVVGKWELDDIPWVEHARHYGNICCYVNDRKGTDFIRQHYIPLSTESTTLRLSVPPVMNNDNNSNTVSSHNIHNNNDNGNENEPIQILTCKVCMQKELSVLFTPCGHIVCCDDCTNSLTECPYCRSIIEHQCRVFF
jgi:hypothetical protein